MHSGSGQGWGVGVLGGSGMVSVGRVCWCGEGDVGGCGCGNQRVLGDMLDEKWDGGDELVLWAPCFAHL